MQTNKKIAVFLDDERQTSFVEELVPNFKNYDWIIIRDYFEFTKYVDGNFQNIGLVSFDHDINSLDWNGKDAADYLLDVCMDNNIPLPDFIVHSMNPIGKENIIGLYKNYLDKVEKRVSKDYWTDFHIGIIGDNLISQKLH
jgi:hypothetical protein